MKKRVLIVSTAVIIAFLIVLILIINKNSIKLKQDEFIYELGESVSSHASTYLKDAGSIKNINDYVLESNELEILDNNMISKELKYLNVGTYFVSIKYKNKTEKFKIKVIDSKQPEFIDFYEEIIIEQNAVDVDLTSFFEAKDFTKVTIFIEDIIDLKVVGEYKTKVNAVDQNNNKTTKNITIKIVDFEKAKQENYVSKNKVGKIYKSSQMIEFDNNKSNESKNNQTNDKNSNNAGNSSSNTIPPKDPSQNNKPIENTPKYRKDISNKYVGQINDYRISNGLPKLPVTQEAQEEADRRARAISINYMHDASYGFGENIGEGSIGVDFFTAWKNSPSHNAAMLREQNVAIAVSVYEINNKWYAVTSFRMNY